MLQNNSMSPSKRTRKKKLNKKSFVSSMVLSAVAVLLCASFTFSWLTSKVDYLNTVIHMGDFSATVNVYYEDGSLLTTGATVGDDVVVNNAISGDTNWSAGTVGYRFIEVKNSGSINLSAFLNLAFDCQNFNCPNNQVTDSFYIRVTDITTEVKNYSTDNGKKLAKYIDSFKSASATAIHNTGKSFTESTKVMNMGTTIGGGTSYYILEYCCYDLSSLLFSSDSYLSIGAKIRVQQTAAPVVTSDEEVVTGNGDESVVKNSNKETADASNSQSNSTVETEEKTTVEETTAQTVIPTTAPATTNATVPVVTEPDTQVTTVPVEEWEIEKSDDSTCKVVSYNGNDKEVKIPATISGLVVNELASTVFANSKAEKITIPATVQYIDMDIFDAMCIKSVDIQKETQVNSVKYTSPYCVENLVIYSADKSTLFKYMVQSNSKEYKIDKYTDTIGDKAFSSVALDSLDLCSVKSISSTAFENATIKNFYFHTSEPPMVASACAFGAYDDSKSGVKLHIPQQKSDDYESDFAFAGYATVKAIKADSELGSGTVEVTDVDGIIYTIIENGSEYDNVRYNVGDEKYLAVVTGYSKISADGIVEIASKIVYKHKESGNSYASPVVGIADNAFENAKSLRVVVMPNSDIYYTSNAFAGCDNLGLIDYASVIPFDVGKFDAILNNNNQTTSDENEDNEE